MTDRTAIGALTAVAVLTVGGIAASLALTDRPERVESSPAPARYLSEVRLHADVLGDVSGGELLAHGYRACAALAEGLPVGEDVGVDRDERRVVEDAAWRHLCPEVAP